MKVSYNKHSSKKEDKGITVQLRCVSVTFERMTWTMHSHVTLYTDSSSGIQILGTVFLVQLSSKELTFMLQSTSLTSSGYQSHN